MTQEELYRGIDDELSWSESDLPERIRTKHVHRLHPYLGKFIPQLVEILRGREAGAVEEESVDVFAKDAEAEQAALRRIVFEREIVVFGRPRSQAGIADVDAAVE